VSAPRKTDAERANINARGAISTAKTRATKLDIIRRMLIDPGHTIEIGTIEALGRSEYSRGFSAGMADANGED
jgi:hypothetical protein